MTTHSGFFASKRSTHGTALVEVHWDEKCKTPMLKNSERNSQDVRSQEN
jgi:hypothetical protein